MWGLDSVFIVNLLKHVTSTQIVFLEHLLLALVAVPLVWLGRKQLKGLSFRHWGALLFISWGGSAIASILFTQAFMYGNASVVLILQKIQPLFAVLLARVMLRERLPRNYWVFFIVAILGTYLLTFGFTFNLGKLSKTDLIGSLLALVAAGLWGGSTVMGRYLLNEIEFRTMTGARFLFALPFLFVIVCSTGTRWGFMFHSAAVPAAFFNLLFQTLFPSLLSLLLYYKGLSLTKASYATLAELAFPATGLLLNWFVLGSKISISQFIGFVIIWLAVFMIARYRDPLLTTETLS